MGNVPTNELEEVKLAVPFNRKLEATLQAVQQDSNV
jgi:hypothetical protein